MILASGPLADAVSDRIDIPLVMLEIVKGLGFVVVTTGILWLALRRWADRIEHAARIEHEAAQRQREATALRARLVSSVSHELRTPLTGIVGFSRTLVEHGDELTDAQRDQIAQRLVANAERLDGLMRDVLDVAQATDPGRPPLRLQEVDVAALARRIAEKRDDGGRTITVSDEPVRAEVDVAMVERMLVHLVDNVHRHTPPTTAAELTVTGGDGAVVVRIEDDGPGLPLGGLEPLVAPFTQGPSSQSAAKPGVGIGLTVVDRLARMHGGRLRAVDNGRGACIELVLPRGDSTDTAGTTATSGARR